MKSLWSLTFLAIIILLSACSEESDTNIESAIEAFEEKNGEFGSADLSFDFDDVKLVKTISVLDSMKILHYSAFKDSFSLERNYIDTFFTSTLMSTMKNDKQLAQYDSILMSKATANTKKVYEKAKPDLVAFADQEQKKLAKYASIKKDYDRYIKADKNEILGKLYEAKYIVTNLETNKKQGKSRKYFFNADGTEVLHVAR